MAEFKSFYKTVESGEGNRCFYPTRLDTYGCGCSHNCSYCYARSLLAFRGLWNPAEPKVADIGKVRRTIAKKCHEGDIVRLGGMTDCFQPIERKKRITYQTIEALNGAGVGYLVVTKSDIIAADDYIGVMDKRLAHIQISVTSTDDRISRESEPGACLPSRRISAIERLQEEGFDVAIRLSPYVPEFVDTGRINSIKCGKLIVEFLRVNGWIQKWLESSGINLSAYSLVKGGYRHLPLDRKRALLECLEIDGREISVCEDVEEHYNFWRANYNPAQDCCNLRK